MSQPESPMIPDEGLGQAGRSRLAFFRDLLLFGMVAGLSVCGVAFIVFLMNSAQRRDRTAEIAALQDCVQLVQEFHALRAHNPEPVGWTAFEFKVADRLQPHIRPLEQRASVNRPASQKLFWVAKYRMREMLESCRTAPGPAENECRNMLKECAAELQYPFPPDL